MNQKPIRILQAFVTNDKGGLTGYIAQNYRYIDKNKVQFDFLTHDEKPLDFEKEFIDEGARFYHIPHPSHPVAYYKALKKIFSENDYKAVSLNLSYANFISVVLAHLAGARKIIIHSHSTAIDDKSKIKRNLKRIIHEFGKRIFPIVADEFAACSQYAARWMFTDRVIKGKHFVYARNAIDLSRFRYNQEDRARLRKELDINSETFCVGHVGRFTYQKNHEYLIDIFHEIVQLHSDSILFLIGGHEAGGTYETVMNKIAAYHLEKKVKILGIRDDVPELLSAMDCFVLPSRFEGLAIVSIEAQASGLNVYQSDVVSPETRITDLVQFLPITKSPYVWAQNVVENISKKRKCCRDEIERSGYDINREIIEIERIYQSL